MITNNTEMDTVLLEKVTNYILTKAPQYRFMLKDRNSTILKKALIKLARELKI